MYNTCMKLISVHVSEKAYLQFKSYAAQRSRAVAELIREAMDLYVDQKIAPARKLHKMPTTSKPKLKRRWTKEEVEEEMFG